MKRLIETALRATVLCSVLACSWAFAADSDPVVDRITFQDGKVMVMQDGKLVPLDKDIKLPNQIKVSTNGTFAVGDGKERELREGQVLNKEGMLVSPDGSIGPVLDHVTIKDGKLIVVRDGESKPLDKNLTFSDGSVLSTDGSLQTADGKMKRLLDGQLLKLDGTVLPAKDTITLREGKVVVQKDGGLLKINPSQTIMMNDGTKVLGSGTIVRPDGTSVSLTEGEVLTIEGVALQKK